MSDETPPSITSEEPDIQSLARELQSKIEEIKLMNRHGIKADKISEYKEL